MCLLHQRLRGRMVNALDLRMELDGEEEPGLVVVNGHLDGHLRLGDMHLVGRGDELDSAAEACRVTGSKQLFRVARSRTAGTAQVLRNGQV